MIEKQIQEEEQFRAEEEFIMMESDTELPQNSSLNDSISLNIGSVSLNRSGHARVLQSGIDISIQTDPAVPDRPKLRINKRIATDTVKSTCAHLSSNCGISVETSRKALQIVCKELYSHDIYLSSKEQQEQEPQSKKSHTYVVPSSRTINEYKQIQASEMEKDAAVALLKKNNQVKATLHFDSTGRSSIDGEWPSIILTFSNKEEYRLRPLFFAYEDREQITTLFVETLTRLACAASTYYNEYVTPATLWEKVDALMTDAVTKNLSIENTIPDAIGSTHHPLHLLCKSHTVEAFDKSNLQVLANIEKSVKQQQIFESINPALRSFFRGKTALVEAGIEALLSLITHDKSARSCSQADLFDFICEREGQTKRIFL